MKVLLVVLGLWLLPTLVILLAALIAVPSVMVGRMATQLFRYKGGAVARSSRP
jgi:hypothetical protein